MLIGCQVSYKRSERALRYSFASICVPAPRKRTYPTKPRAPKKTKVISQTKVEEAPPIIPEDTVVWEKELDDLFRTLLDPQEEGVSSTEKDTSCP